MVSFSDVDLQHVFDRIDCFSISVFVCFTCEIVTATVNRLRCLGYSANFPTIGFANTNETVQHVDDQHPPSPTACGIHDPVSSELLSSNAHNNTNKQNEDEHRLIFRILALVHIYSVKCPILVITCKHVTFAQKNGANLPPQRDPWHSSHI